MKKYLFVMLSAVLMIFTACGNSSNQGTAGKANQIDSAANNGIIPPSSSPSNATNSSLADTTYPASDSSKHRDSLRSK